MNRMDPVGMCFSAKNNFRQIRAHRPCVESGRELFIFIRINLLFFFFSLNCVPVNRRALPDMCGTRVILKDANPLVHVTRLEIILRNFSSIRRVEQVSVYKLCTQSNPTKNDLMNLSLLLDDGKVTINEISTQPRTFLMHKSVCYFWFLKWLCRIIHLSSTFYIHPYIMTQWAKLIDLFYPLCTSNPSFTLLECAAQLYILLQGTQITKKNHLETLHFREMTCFDMEKNPV